jgi:hypothetical protein
MGVLPGRSFPGESEGPTYYLMHQEQDASADVGGRSGVSVSTAAQAPNAAELPRLAAVVSMPVALFIHCRAWLFLI